MSAPSPYIVGPAAGHAHTHTIIILHGRDSNGEDFATEFFECEASPTQSSSSSDDRTLPAVFPTIRWVFPRAPILHSERFDTDMSQWFDMWSVENPFERPESQTPGLHSSVDAITKIVQDEEKIVPRERIFLGGISQGFATALATFFAEGKGLDSPEENIWKDQDEKMIRGTPILLQHSEDGEVVPIGNGRQMSGILMGLGMEVESHEYEDGGHWVNEPKGADHFAEFVLRNMK